MEIPETPTPTKWEEKERAGLLAQDRPAGWDKLRTAEDPGTTPATLARLAGEMYPSYYHFLMARAIAAHPDTSPKTLRSLFARLRHGGDYRDEEEAYFCACARSLCRNPALPQLSLERPDFWGQVHEAACLLLLGEEALPPDAVASFLQRPGEGIAEAARLHIALAGEIQTRSEGRAALTAFWRASCEKEKQGRNWDEYRHPHAECVELGMAPRWAADGKGNTVTPPPVPPVSHEVREWYSGSPAKAEVHRRLKRWLEATTPHSTPRQSDACTADEDFDLLLARWLSLNARELTRMVRIANGAGGAACEILVNHPGLNALHLRLLLMSKRDPDYVVRVHLAAHPRTPPAVTRTHHPPIWFTPEKTSPAWWRSGTTS